MPKHPIPPRPVTPGRLAVRRDTTSRGEPRWAILSALPLHPKQGLLGHLRGYGESHHGLYAYSFYTRETALQQARQIMGSLQAVWTEE